MIDQVLKRCLGQMMHGVQVVGAHNDGVSRAYCSHWVSQVSFEEPILMASVSPKHDTYPLLVATGQFAVSVLAGDQVAAGQYFSYPGRKFRYLADEFLVTFPGAELPVVRDAIAWLRCEVFDTKEMADHVLFFARVVAVQPGRLKEPPLPGWSTHHLARRPGSGWPNARCRSLVPSRTIRCQPVDLRSVPGRRFRGSRSAAPRTGDPRSVSAHRAVARSYRNAHLVLAGLRSAGGARRSCRVVGTSGRHAVRLVDGHAVR